MIDKMKHELERYRIISEAAGISHWYIDIRDGDPVNPENTLFWSDSFIETVSEFFGTELPNTMAELKTLLHKIDNGDSSRTRGAYLNHINDVTGKTPFDLEYRLMTRNGDYRYLRIFGAVKRDENGKALQMFGALVDVTSKRVMEEIHRRDKSKIEELSHWHKTILDTVPLAVMVQDINENVTFINRAAEDFLGKRREEIIGFPCRNNGLSICDTEDCAIACAKRGLKCTSLHRDDLSYRIDVEFIKDVEGNNIGYVEIIQDVTEIENLARREADEENRAKSEFLAIMSHEIRTPLNTIIGMAQIGRNSDDNERKNSSLEKISDASEHLLGIVSDILDMSKINAKKIELYHVNFSLRRMVDKVVMIISPRIESQEQLLTINIDDDVPDYLAGDDQHLSQVVSNLLSNSAKFTRNKGKIGLNVSLQSEQDGVCTIKFVVSDTGIGIAPEQQAKLFNSFEQAERGIKREFGGTGLGLAISKNLVELMGGKIHMMSELGKGSRFIFTVKLERAKPENVPENEEPDEDNGSLPDNIFARRTMLIVDDVEVNREIIMSLLENTAIKTYCAEDGEQAVELLKKHPDKYDVILMDVHMPKMDGIEATRKIREFCKTTPIIAMTANVFKDNIQACIKAGMNDHITKPLKVNKFFRKMREYLE